MIECISRQAQQLLTSIETEVINIGLQLNSKKTEVMTFNQTNPVNIRLNNCGTLVNNITNFKYLGAWIAHKRFLNSQSFIMFSNTQDENNLELQNGKQSENKNLQSYNLTHIIIW